jgi:hypothetical protein
MGISWRSPTNTQISYLAVMRGRDFDALICYASWNGRRVDLSSEEIGKSFHLLFGPRHKA